MIPLLKSAGLRLMLAGVFALGSMSAPTAAPAQNVVKVVDLFTGTISGTPFGPSFPQSTLKPVGTNFWFTAQDGGSTGTDGGVFSYDPVTGLVEQIASFNANINGKDPSAAIVLAAGKAWVTTSSGGTNNRGTFVSIETNAPYLTTNWFNFPTNSPIGRSPSSTPVLIGDELWFTCASGGAPPDGSLLWGTIAKFSLTNFVVTNVLTFDRTNNGAQPLGSSLVKVGDAYYYTTFAGGTNSGAGIPNGGGTLGRVTFDLSGNPTFTKLVDFPHASVPGRYSAFPAADVVADGTNLLYFTTVGNATNPGALLRYDVANNQVTNLFIFNTNIYPPLTFGRTPYSTPVLWNNALYFTTLNGGVSNAGVLAKFDLSNNTYTKLVEFERAAGLALGASPQYHGGTLYTNADTGRIGILWVINRGGVFNNNGTIIRVDLPPPPVVTTASTNGGFVLLSWTGGYSPFSIDRTEDLSAGAWTTNWLTGITSNAISIPLTGAQAFFRVVSTNQ